MTRGERAAVRFVRELLPERALAVINGFRNPAYERVLAACRRDLRIRASSNNVALLRLAEAFPQKQRQALERLLKEALYAEFDRRRVLVLAAFRVGVAVGRSQTGAARRKAGTR
jgi:hypothetical protein